MKNKDLAKDYFERGGHRLAALAVLMERKSYADVVREAQEIVELLTKAILRQSGVEVPRVHDVSDIFKQQQERIVEPIRPHINKICEISKNMRRDRELSFYGTEDLTPSEFYEVKDAEKALDDARWLYAICQEVF